jgi:arylsulfatase A-like enzyme
MRAKTVVIVAVLLVASCSAPDSPQPVADGRPNIVVILTDDQGYADISLNPFHGEDVSTPNMDALAADGVFFTQAYTSSQTCSPTRTGLMLGRYQHRVGVYTKTDSGRGFDPTTPFFPSFLPDTYTAAAIGKWHLGLDLDYPELKWHPMNRGFDENYVFMGRGGRDYMDLRAGDEADNLDPLYRNRERLDDEGYLTDRITEEAVAFIDRNKSRPFFLYLAYTALHSPAQAPQASIDLVRAQFPDISDQRAILMAMLRHLDDGVGVVVEKLKQEALFDNTVVFFLTDNGGSQSMASENTPLSGFKGSLREGGIRTPFIVSWPDRFPGGRSVDVPMISLDILPTALDALGILPASNDFDGRSMLPLLTGESTRHHDILYWSDGSETGEWAVRRGDWKLRGVRGRRRLINLAADPAEETNVGREHPEIAKSLGEAYDAWLDQMPEPNASGTKRWEDDAVRQGSNGSE